MLIAGGGPVGLTLAIDLAWRGIDVIVAERRPPNDPPNVKCGQIGAARSAWRSSGGSAWPTSCAASAVACGLFQRHRLGDQRHRHRALPRVLIPAQAALVARLPQPGRTLPGRRPSTRIAAIKKFFEPVLFAHAAEQPRIRILHSTADHGPRPGRAGRDRERRRLRRRHSLNDRMRLPRRMRRTELRLCASRSAPSSSAPWCFSTRNRSMSGRAAAREPAMPGKPAWLYFSLNPRRCGGDDGCRRAGDLEHTEFLLSWRKRAGSSLTATG